MLARAPQDTVRAKRESYATRIIEVEQYLGLLRAKDSILEQQEMDAVEQIGGIRETFDHYCLSANLSDNEDGNSFSAVFPLSSDEPQLPPSSDPPQYTHYSHSEGKSESSTGGYQDTVEILLSPASSLEASEVH